MVALWYEVILKFRHVALISKLNFCTIVTGCLSGGCHYSIPCEHLEFDLSAQNQATKVWWRSQDFVINALNTCPKPQGVSISS